MNRQSFRNKLPFAKLALYEVTLWGIRTRGDDHASHLWWQVIGPVTAAPSVFSYIAAGEATSAQGLTLVQIIAQLEHLRDTFMV